VAEVGTAFVGGHVVLPELGTIRADLGIDEGRIAAIAEPGLLHARDTVDVSGLHVFPGVIDPHAHIGLGGGMDEYEPDTGAAARGGVTTVLYILIEPGSYLAALEQHDSVVSRVAHIDYGFHLTLMSEEHLAELTAIQDKWAVRSYKYYMSFRGDEGAYMGVSGTDDGAFYGILQAVSGIGGILMVHPENIEVVWRLREAVKASGASGLAAWDASRPAFVEAEALYRAGMLGAVTDCPLYFVHVSSAEAVESLRAIRDRYPEAILAAETCGHYLTHSMASSVGVMGKVNPPLRSEDDLDAVWSAVSDRTIDTMGSDHVGRRRSAKEGDIWKASAGFPGMPTTLPVLLSYGHHQHSVPLERIAELTSLHPARLFGLAERKGRIQPGYDADVTIVDLQAVRRASAADLGTWSDYSLYENEELRGWPVHTLVRGEFVMRDGELVGAPGYGKRQSTFSGLTSKPAP
jgi:dihydropyrimidinase